jgi:hypothetical protein
MYDELVKRLRSAESNYQETLDCLSEAADAIEELMRRCEQFQYMPPPAWIPVTERLPYESVFVYGKGGELVVAQYSHKHKWWEDDEGYYCDTNYVTHWMPLPEPPEKGE